MASVYHEREIDSDRARALLAERDATTGKHIQSQATVARLMNVGLTTLKSRLREAERAERAGVHPGVPRDETSVHQAAPSGTPPVSQGTPWLDELAAAWPELQALVEERRSRQRLLGTPVGTPRHTVKKTYVVDTRYVELIARYADLERLDYAEVLAMALREFFETRGFLPTQA